jgi:hypothetical protein
MGKKSRRTRLRGIFGHRITQDVLSKLIVAAVLASAKALRDSKRVRLHASRPKNRINTEASAPAIPIAWRPPGSQSKSKR